MAKAATKTPVKTAKIFMNGRSQAVRLPKEFRFEGKEVNITRDPKTGSVTLAAKRQSTGSWDEFFALQASLEIPDDFLLDRDDSPAPDRVLF